MEGEEKYDLIKECLEVAAVKKKRLMVWVLTLLPLAAVLVSIIYLPEIIPVNFGFSNQAARLGSKYEMLIFPIITATFGFAMLGAAKLSSKFDGSRGESMCLTAAISFLVLFNAMTYFFLYEAFKETKNLSLPVPDIDRIIYGILILVVITAVVVTMKAKRK